jgi:uncharacterized membrane protein
MVMNRNNTNWIRNSIIVIGIVLIAFVIECIGFNWHSIFRANEPITFDLGQSSDNVTVTKGEKLVPLTENEINEIEVKKANEKLLAEVNKEEYIETVDPTLIKNEDGELCRKVYKTFYTLNIGKEYYIKKAHVVYPTDTKLGYSFTLVNDDIPSNKVIYDTLNNRLGESVTNIFGQADKVIMEVSASDEFFNGTGLMVTISNQFSVNYCRILFLIGAMLAIAFLLLSKKVFQSHLEIAFIVFSLIFGSFLIVLDGTNQLSWDEYLHFDNAYRSSFGQEIRYTEAAIQMKGQVMPSFDTIEEKSLLASYTQERNDFAKADVKYQQRFAQYNVRAYLPQSIMLAIAKICHMPFSIAYMMGKFGNLLFYTLIMALAIRISKIGKIYIALIGLLPTPLFLATAYAYDAVVTAFVFLGFVLWLNEIQDKEKKMKWYTALAMILCFVIGCWSKVIYMVMMLLLCFLPKEKFDSKFKSALFRVGAVIIVAILLITIYKSPIEATGVTANLQSDGAYLGDKRAIGTNFLGQIQYIFSHPITYALVLLRSLKNSAYDYLLGTSTWLLYGYAGRFPVIFTGLTSVLLLGTSLVQTEEDRKYVLEKRWKVLLGIMAFGVASLVWTGLYITFTSVGANYISGVQGRYYIPFILPLMFVFKNSKFKLNLSTEMYTKIVFSILIFINLYGTYVYFLRPRCF